MRETLRFLRDVGIDLANGRNIFVYLSVALAIAAPVIAYGYRFSGKTIPTETWALLTLTVLGLVAALILATQRRLGALSEDFQSIQRGSFLPIRQHSNWNSKEGDRLVNCAQRSLSILTTWPVDIHLGDDLRQACSKCANTLDVKIFVADPQGNMGPRRVAERLPDFDRLNYSNFPIEKYAREHLEIARHAVEDIGNRLSGVRNIHLKIYAYPTIPTVRIYCIDDKDFFFGWHPLGRLSNQNPCFHVTESIATRELVQELRNELANVEKISREIGSFENGKLVLSGW